MKISTPNDMSPILFYTSHGLWESTRQWHHDSNQSEREAVGRRSAEGAGGHTDLEEFIVTLVECSQQHAKIQQDTAKFANMVDSPIVFFLGGGLLLLLQEIFKNLLKSSTSYDRIVSRLATRSWVIFTPVTAATMTGLSRGWLWQGYLNPWVNDVFSCCVRLVTDLFRGMPFSSHFQFVVSQQIDITSCICPTSKSRVAFLTGLDQDFNFRRCTLRPIYDFLLGVGSRDHHLDPSFLQRHLERFRSTPKPRFKTHESHELMETCS